MKEIEKIISLINILVAKLVEITLDIRLGDLKGWMGEVEI